MVLNEGNQSKLLAITQEEYKFVERLKGQLILEVNLDDGFVTISANMPEAIASAELTLKAQELLQQYVISFKVKKSKEQLKFIQDRYGEKEKEFKAIQQKLALYRDQNRSVNSAIAQTTLQRLQSEYDLSYGVCSELAKQLETQQIKVEQDTPVFTVLKPVNVPIEKSEPKRGVIIVLSLLLGILLGLGLIFMRFFLESIKTLSNQQ